MSQSLVYLLLFVALVLPIPGALLLRLLGSRLGDQGLAVGATLIFGLAIAGVLTLSRADVPLLRVGDLTLLLSGTRRGQEVVLPPEVALVDDPEIPGPPELPTLTPRPSATPSASPTPEVTATPSASPTPEATVTPAATVTATPEPPTATPATQAGPRRYTVVAGDTVRAIAERFGVTVQALLEANDLTPAEADSLSIGQELVIP